MAILIGVPAAELVGFAVAAVAVQAATRATSGSANLSFRKRESFTFGFSFVSVARCLGRLDVGGRRPLVAGRGHGGRPALEQADRAIPQAEEAVGREEHDDQED